MNVTGNASENKSQEQQRVAAMLAALASIGVPNDGIQTRPDFEAPKRCETVETGRTGSQHGEIDREEAISR